MIFSSAGKPRPLQIRSGHVDLFRVSDAHGRGRRAPMGGRPRHDGGRSAYGDESHRSCAGCTHAVRIPGSQRPLHARRDGHGGYSAIATKGLCSDTRRDARASLDRDGTPRVPVGVLRRDDRHGTRNLALEEPAYSQGSAGRARRGRRRDRGLAVPRFGFFGLGFSGE